MSATPPAGINVARRLTVLVVDDESSILRMLARSLDRFGYATLEVPNSEDALACMRSNRVDAAILDMRMPGSRTGLELLEALRTDADPQRRKLPVLILTGVTLSYDEEARARALGARVFYKPQAVEALVQTLDELLGRKRG